MVAAIDRLPDSFPDDNGARAQVFPQNADAADSRVRREPANHPRDRSAVTIDIASVSGLDLDLNTGVDDVEIIQKADTNQIGMIDFNS